MNRRHRQTRLPHGKHGHTRRDGYRSPTYMSWYSMLMRCEHTNFTVPYSRYGAKGKTVCERWHTFVNFLADMGERPPGTTLDRYPDSDGNYGPDNCRWATSTEQARNRWTTKLSFDEAQEILGRLEHGEHAGSVAARFGISAGTVGNIRNGETWKELPPFSGRPRGIRIVHPSKVDQADQWLLQAPQLTFDQVQEILGRLEHGEHEASVAARFCVALRTISEIRTGKTWKEAPPFQNRPAGVRIVHPSKVLQRFQIGEVLEWKAQKAILRGTVIEVVPANEKPANAVRVRYGVRSIVSYVVKDEHSILFWPVAPRLITSV